MGKAKRVRIAPKATKRYAPTTRDEIDAEVIPGVSVRLVGRRYLREEPCGGDDTLARLLAVARAGERSAWAVLADAMIESPRYAAHLPHVNYPVGVCRALAEGAGRAGDDDVVERWVRQLSPHRAVWVEVDTTFRVGDVVVVGSYNLTYTGEILAIGPSTVSAERHGKTSRFDLFTFYTMNWDLDLADVADRNLETSRYL